MSYVIRDSPKDVSSSKIYESNRKLRIRRDKVKHREMA